MTVSATNAHVKTSAARVCQCQPKRHATTADDRFIFELVNDPAFIRNIGDRGVRTLAYAERLSPSPSAFDESGEVRQWLAQVRPEDFSSCIDEEEHDMRRRAEGS